MKQALQRYSHILSADDHYSSWQEVVILSWSKWRWQTWNKKSGVSPAWNYLTITLVNWQVEAECKEDPEGLALRLAGKGAVSAALEVAESAGLSIDLRRELQGRQLVKLLTADPLNGGGPAEASRFLSSLRDSDDALPVAMGAMQLLPNLRSKQLLVITCPVSWRCDSITFNVLFGYWNFVFLHYDFLLCLFKGSLLSEAKRRKSVRCWGFAA